MKTKLLSSLVALLSTYAQAANYNTQTGSLVIPDVSIDGKLLYKNVTLQLNMDKSVFSVVDTQALDVISIPKDSFDVGGVTVNLFNCSRTTVTPKNVVCNLTVTNNQPDKSFSISSNTTIYDNASNAYSLTASTLANKSNSSYGSTVSAQLIQGTTAKLTLSFVMPENINNISAFAMSFSDSSYKSYDHTSRNIAIL